MKRIIIMFLIVTMAVFSSCSQFPGNTATAERTESASFESETERNTEAPISHSESVEPSETDTERIYSELIMNYLSFEDAVKQANVGLEAVYKGRIDGIRTFEEVFEAKSILFGKCDDKEIHVFYSYASVEVVDEETGKEYHFNTWENKFTKGEKYILILNRANYLFYDYPHYLPHLGQFLAEDENNYTLWNEPIEFLGVTIQEALKALREGIPDEQPYNPILNPAPIIEGKDAVETMILNSMHVGLIELTAVENDETDHHGCLYRAKTLELFTKEEMDLYEDGSFLIVLDREKTSAGNVYLCGFNAADEGSVIYTQMTKEGVFQGEDEAAVKEAKELLNAN